MQHSLYFKALFVVVALGLYNFYSSKWSPPSHSSLETSDFVKCHTASNLTYYVFVGPLEQSVGDTRQHQLIKLPNNMVVLCTSDPDSAESAASLSVNIGSMTDPKEFPGMAHFLEHMLFLGSAKYPIENEYAQYIDNNLGHWCAGTGTSETTFYFSIANPAFEGALDRFSRFFIDPLLLANSVDREVNAVDSEFKGYLQSDGWRLYQLIRSLSNSNHPYNHFNVGNLDTLQVAAHTMGKNLHEEVMMFYQKYYSADIMKLAVAGNHSVEQLVEWTVEKFSQVESKGNTKLQYKGHPLDHHALGKLVHMETIGNINEMSLQFALPEMKSLYLADPTTYVSSLLSSESPGSLLFYLKKQGWVTSIYGFLHNMYTGLHDGFDIFTLSFDFTPQGMVEYKQVIEAMFAYLQMLKEAETQQKTYSEIQTINQLKFQYYEKPTVLEWVQGTSSNRHNKYLALEHYLSKNAVVRDFNAIAITNILNYFNPQNYQAFLLAQSHAGIVCNETEKYYNTSYHVSDLPPHLVSNTLMDWQKYGFHLPAINPFMPENNVVKAKPDVTRQPATTPMLLQKDNMHELWFKQDDQFFTPRGTIYLKIRLANANASKLDMLTAQILNYYIKKLLSEELYTAQHAGIDFKIDFTETKLKIKVTGFNDKLVHLLTTLLHKIQTFTVEQNVYDISKAEIKQAFENVKFEEPVYQLFHEKNDQLNMVPFVPTSSLEQLLDQVTIGDVQKHIKTVFNTTYFKMLMVGNFEQTEAVDAAQQVSQMLKSQPLPANSHSPSRIVNIEPGHYIYRHMGEDPNMLNNVVVATFYCGMVTNPKDRTTMALLLQIINDQFFDQLRTKEQLGYNVGTTTHSYSSGKLVLELSVQGESNPTYLLQRIDRFVHEFQQTLAEFDTVKFDSLVQSIVSKANEQATSVDAEANRMWTPIDKGTYNFALLADEVESLQNARLDDVLDMWDRYINPETTVKYTRVDSQMWSIKKSYPSATDMATWPETILALAGCLESETHMPVDLSDLSCFVHTAVTQSNTDALASLACLYPTANSTQVLNESAPGWSKIKNALDMAMNPHGSHVLPSSKTDFSHIGMYQTVEGKWVITDVDKFKATQVLHELPVPVIKLIPNTTAF